MDYRVYFDMDGVVADFDRGIRELCGIPGVDANTDDEEMDAFMWSKVREIPHFYDKLEPMPGAVEMFDYIYGVLGENCEILTGIPKPHRGIEHAGEDKIEWTHRVLSDAVKVNVVHKEDKKHYCTGPECILIDDLKANIRDWTEAGGTGILFESCEQTIDRLRVIGVL